MLCQGQPDSEESLESELTNSLIAKLMHVPLAQACPTMINHLTSYSCHETLRYQQLAAGWY